MILLWVLWSFLYGFNGAYVSPPLLAIWGVACATSVLLWWRGTSLSVGFLLRVCTPLAAMSWIVFFAPGSHWSATYGLLVLVGSILAAPNISWLNALGGVLVVTGGIVAVAHAWHWGVAPIDVFDITQSGAVDFLHGINPYRAWFPSTTLGIVRFHYDYGPLLLPLSSPFAALGDVRVLGALSATAIAALVVRARGWRQPDAWRWALLLWASPWEFWCVLQGWTELVAIAPLMWWYVERDRPWAWLLLVLSLGINPAVGLVLVPLFVTTTSTTRRQILYAGSVGLLCWAVAWGFSGPDFIRAFSIASRQLFDPTVGLGGLYMFATHRALPILVPIVAMFVGCAILWRRRPMYGSAGELAVGLVSAAVVFCLPATYFEYAMIPAVWIWLWLARGHCPGPVQRFQKPKVFAAAFSQSKLSHHHD